MLRNHQKHIDVINTWIKSQIIATDIRTLFIFSDKDDINPRVEERLIHRKFNMDYLKDTDIVYEVKIERRQ